MNTSDTSHTHKEHKEYDVVGMGHALMDIIVTVDDEFLQELDVAKGSMTLIDDTKHAALIKMLSDKELKLATGGSASNTIKGISILGGKGAFMGMIGNDDYGNTYEKLLSESHVKPVLGKCDKDTGIAIICVTPDGERTMLTYLGAASEFRIENVDEEIIKRSKILHIEGYFIGNPETEKAVLKAMEIAKATQKKISIDLSDPGLITSKLESIKTILKEYVDIVFVNEYEAKAFTGSTGSEEEEAVNILSEYCDVAIVKLGAKGSIIKHHDRASNTKTFHKIPIHRVEVVNTNGAGDAYAAGILYAIAYYIPMNKAGTLASYISSRVVSIPEATLSHGIEDDVKKIVEE